MLQARHGAPVAPEQGRALLLSLVRLHELGALAFGPDPDGARGPRDVPSLPGFAARSAAEGFGSRDGSGPDGTAPAYNMGQSVYKTDDSK